MIGSLRELILKIKKVIRFFNVFDHRIGFRKMEREEVEKLFRIGEEIQELLRKKERYVALHSLEKAAIYAESICKRIITPKGYTERILTNGEFSKVWFIGKEGKEFFEKYLKRWR